MFLKKNLWGTVFSQWEQLEKTNEAFITSAFIDTDEIHNNVISDVYTYDGEHISSKEFEYNSLLNALTLEEKESERFIVKFLNINSEYSEYAPSFYDGELVFASSRNISSISKTFDEQNDQPFLDLYITAKKSDKQKAKKLKGGVNTKFHESSAVFSKDKKTVYFTRNNYSNKVPKRNTKGTVLLKIYSANYDEGKWKNVVELPFSSDEYSIAHPALSPDGKFLYFASDMPGSFGESDLYVVEIKEDGSFSAPKNLGGQINTDGRETFPYISDRGKLFFASDGHKGLGGLDIFMALPDQNKDIMVYNLEEPINSPHDDFTFIINEENEIGFFASNRKGGKDNDDIYGFRQLVSFPKAYQPRLKTIKKLERIIDVKANEEGYPRFEPTDHVFE